MTEALQRALTPWGLGGLTLRNRIVKTATHEGMSPSGRVTPDLIEHHVRLARGGVGMTTLAYVAVEPDGRTFHDQLVAHADTWRDLRPLTDGVHAEGTAASVQLAHAGGFSKVRGQRGVPAGPSVGWNRYGTTSGLPVVRSMTARDRDAVAEAFARAAVGAIEAGFDAVELHLGHGYLLSQWLSPVFNRRRDDHGGDLAHRLRFPLDVVARVREAVGDRGVVLAKVNLDDGVPSGSSVGDAIGIARALEAEGVDALVLSGGLVSHSAFFLMRGDVPLAQMAAAESNPLQALMLRWFGRWLVRPWAYDDLFFLDPASELRAAVGLPLVLLGGVVSAEGVATAMQRGFDAVAVGRALIHDPDWVRRLASDSAWRSPCTHCNLCVAARDDGGVRCLLPDAGVA